MPWFLALPKGYQDVLELWIKECETERGPGNGSLWAWKADDDDDDDDDDEAKHEGDGDGDCNHDESCSVFFTTTVAAHSPSLTCLAAVCTPSANRRAS